MTPVPGDQKLAEGDMLRWSMAGVGGGMHQGFPLWRMKLSSWWNATCTYPPPIGMYHPHLFPGAFLGFALSQLRKTSFPINSILKEYLPDMAPSSGIMSMTPQRQENPPCPLGPNCPRLASHSTGKLHISKQLETLESHHHITHIM